MNVVQALLARKITFVGPELLNPAVKNQDTFSYLQKSQSFANGSSRDEDRGMIDLAPDLPLSIGVGPGLVNLGNTCFLNSVLQCLTYTAPLANFLLSGSHTRVCKQKFCPLCDLQRHVSSCFAKSRQHNDITPTSIVRSLKAIAKHMRLGRQEDAHEFIRYYVEALEKRCVKIGGRSIIGSIFGGKLQSEVICLRCKTKSAKQDPMLDLSLEIQNCSSVEDALRKFTEPELLSGSNRYFCEKCKSLVEAKKKLQISEPPPVLTVHLKRFDAGRQGQKISRPIKFNTSLNFDNYGSSDSKKFTSYELYAVLVHAGHTCHSGHYYSFVKAPSGLWYRMNDSQVNQVGVKTVLNEAAYMLFYISKQRFDNVKETEPVARNGSVQSPTKLKSLIQHHLGISKGLEPSNIQEISGGTTHPQRQRVAEPNSSTNAGKAMKNVTFATANGMLTGAPLVSTWGEIESEVMERQRAGFIQGETRKMKRPNSYDLAYDRGKSKKVRMRQQF